MHPDMLLGVEYIKLLNSDKSLSKDISQSFNFFKKMN